MLTSRTRPTAALLGILALVLLMLGGILPAQAHSVLLSTVPEADEQLASAPDEAVFTFNEDITDLGTEVAITSPDGELVSDGAVIIEGPVVRQPLVDARPAGAYTVTWRAVSADGHPISGQFVFTAAAAVGVEEPSDGTSSEETSAGETNAGESSAEVATADETSTEDTIEDEATPDTTTATAEPEATESGFPPMTWFIIGVVAAAAIALVVIVSRGLMKNTEDKNPQGSDK